MHGSLAPVHPVSAVDLRRNQAGYPALLAQRWRLYAIGGAHGVVQCKETIGPLHHARVFTAAVPLLAFVFIIGRIEDGGGLAGKGNAIRTGRMPNARGVGANPITDAIFGAEQEMDLILKDNWAMGRVKGPSIGSRAAVA